MEKNLIDIKNLYVEYSIEKGILGKTEKIHAVNGVNLDIKRGEILALAGESGCGKSTLAKTILKLENKTLGEIQFDGANIDNFDKNQMKHFRKSSQIIFQNPYASLDPKNKVFDILAEPLLINTDFDKKKIKEIVLEKLHQVGMDENCLDLYPHEFSGGQRQRIAIARALVLEPELIIADEPVSALDVSIQAQIINLLKELKEKFNLTILLITHDMRVIEYISDRTAIMYLGEIVEIGNTKEIFNNPKHPYTKALLNAVPKINATKLKNEDKLILTTEIPSPSNLPKGCKFHTRCPDCMSICKVNLPSVTSIEENHSVKCFLYENNK